MLDVIAREKTRRSTTERKATARQRERAQTSPLLQKKPTPGRATANSSVNTETSWNLRDMGVMVLVILSVGILYKYISASKRTTVRGKKKRSRSKKH